MSEIAFSAPASFLLPQQGDRSSSGGQRQEKAGSFGTRAARKNEAPLPIYLPLFEERMEQRDFPRDHKLYRLTKRAHDALRELFLECHELGTTGDGRRVK